MRRSSVDTILAQTPKHIFQVRLSRIPVSERRGLFDPVNLGCPLLAVSRVKRSAFVLRLCPGPSRHQPSLFHSKPGNSNFRLPRSCSPSLTKTAADLPKDGGKVIRLTPSFTKVPFLALALIGEGGGSLRNAAEAEGPSWQELNSQPRLCRGIPRRQLQPLKLHLQRSTALLLRRLRILGAIETS